MTHRRGFTLLELLLATVLSVMLMLGVLAVVTDLSTVPETVASREDRSAAPQTQTLDAWVRLLRGDLAHAIHIDAASASRIEMLGSGALDERGRSRTHRPVKVSYFLETLDGQQWLVRRQIAQDSLAVRAIQRDLLCRGVQRFELIAEGAAPTTQEGPQPVSAATIAADRSPAGSADDAAADPIDPEPVQPSEETMSEEPESARKPDDSGRLEFGRAAGFDTVYNKSNGETSIFVNGLWFYPRYAPKWARKKYYAETGRQDPTAPRRATSDANAPDDGRGPGGDEDDTSAGPSTVGVTWRIRVWLADSDEPTYDRIVTVQLSGGA